MDYLLFTAYFLLGWIFIKQSRFVRNADLSIATLTILYCLKVAAGVALGYISFKYYPQGSDYAMIHKEGLINYEMLKNSLLTFLKDFFYSPYGHYDAYFDSVGSYWTDLKNNIIIKTVAILNLFSGGNYYINSIFFNIGGFIACIALYRMFMSFYADYKLPVLFSVFLLPSTLYFSSGIHKDAVVFIAMSFLSYALLHKEKINRKKWILIIVNVLVLLLIRNYVLPALVPAFMAYRYALKVGVRKSFLTIYSIAFIGFVALEFSNFTSVSEIIYNKQQAFLALPEANSQIPIYTLHNSAWSLIKAIPHAFVNVSTQPRPWEQSEFLLLAAIEWYFYLTVILIGFFVWRTYSKNNTLILSCFLFVIPMLLLSGWIVPNAGSLIRYRALFLPWLLTPFFVLTYQTLKYIRLKNI